MTTRSFVITFLCNGRLVFNGIYKTTKRSMQSRVLYLLFVDKYNISRSLHLRPRLAINQKFSNNVMQLNFTAGLLEATP